MADSTEPVLIADLEIKLVSLKIHLQFQSNNNWYVLLYQ